MIVINLQLQPRESGVPRWAKVFFIQKIGSYLCVKHGLKLSHPSAVHPMTNPKSDTEMTPSSVPPMGHEIRFVTSSSSSIQKNYSISNPMADSHSLQSLLEFYRARARRKDNQRQTMEEWIVLATVVDRLLCIAFAIAIIVFTVSTLLSLVTDSSTSIL